MFQLHFLNYSSQSCAASATFWYKLNSMCTVFNYRQISNVILINNKYDFFKYAGITFIIPHKEQNEINYGIN